MQAVVREVRSWATAQTHWPRPEGRRGWSRDRRVTPGRRDRSSRRGGWSRRPRAGSVPRPDRRIGASRATSRSSVDQPMASASSVAPPKHPHRMSIPRTSTEPMSAMKARSSPSTTTTAPLARRGTSRPRRRRAPGRDEGGDDVPAELGEVVVVGHVLREGHGVHELGDGGGHEHPGDHQAAHPDEPRGDDESRDRRSRRLPWSRGASRLPLKKSPSRMWTHGTRLISKHRAHTRDAPPSQ